jgi:ubiquinone/menaquinone biosynthesis C-methylase UbiE
MVSDQSSRSGFSNVDRDDDPAELIHLLDLRSSAPFHLAYKQRAFELLDLRESDRVLDVGCGTGDDVRHLAQLVGSGGSAVGVDASETMIAEARVRSTGSELPIAFVVADVDELPFADGSFDACLAIRTFQHLAEPVRALTEMIRVVRPGGRLAVVDPDHDTAVFGISDRELARKFLNFRADAVRNGGIAHQMFSLFKEHGLLDVSVMPTTEVRTDYAEIEAASHYEGGIRIAQEKGALTPTEADHLVSMMREVGGAGHFLSAMTYFLTAGRKA